MAKLIYGTGDFADIIYHKMKEDGMKVDGFTVEEAYIKENVFLGMPIFPYEELQECFPQEDISFYIGVIGERGMLDLRRKIHEKIKKDGYLLNNYISSKAYVATQDVGEGNVILENVIIESHCSVGDGNIFWPAVVLPHHNRVGSFCNLGPGASFSGYSSIGTQCYIGNNAVLNNHVHVHDLALVGAGVFANKDVPENAVLVSQRAYLLEGRKSWEFK